MVCTVGHSVEDLHLEGTDGRATLAEMLSFLIIPTHLPNTVWLSHDRTDDRQNRPIMTDRSYRPTWSYLFVLHFLLSVQVGGFCNSPLTLMY